MAIIKCNNIMDEVEPDPSTTEFIPEEVYENEY
jgi:hypothetical protein